ncbi:MAG: cphA 1 [Planctomycetota bacterium]|nr:cphA 1 [Planctomycetota bacterium]
MEFRKVLALRGPNVWANFPVLEAWVDLGEYKDCSSDVQAGFNDRLMGWLPTMVEHRCSIGTRGGFFERLRRGTYPAHILEHVTLELMTLAGSNVGFGRARETNEVGVYKVAVQYEEEAFARQALEVGRELYLAAHHDRPFEVTSEVVKLRDLLHDVRLGPSTGSIVKAAHARGIPSRRLSEGSLVQLGWGIRQRRILTAETDRTGAIAEGIAQDKELTRALLARIGVPVPEGRSVTDENDAWSAAEEIGVPVVVKPQHGNQGRGVATNLTAQAQVVVAYHAARLESSDGSVIVEKFAPGDDYRVLVVGNDVVAAARREPAHVIGDGLGTIEELVALVNLDPRRGDGHATSLSHIKLNDIALAVLGEQGLVPTSVPQAGRKVLIRRNANLSTGGTAEDVTDRVHPDLAARCVEAARMIGLDIAGIDVVAQDISRPMESQGGVIVEVNAGPGLRMHLEPSQGMPRPVGRAIVDMMFADGEDGRIPVVAVTGTNGKTTVTRFIAHLLRCTGKTVGMTCTEGIYVDERRIESGDCSGPVSATSILMHPMVEAAVLETARGGILRAGLAFDLCDVAVVTNIGEGDHLGLNDVHTVDRLAKVKRTIVDVVKPTGAAVLKADDPLTAQMAAHCPGSVVFFALDGECDTILAHRASGGRAVFVRDETVILAEGARETMLVRLADVPLTHGGRIGFQIENTLAAAAAGWSLGMNRDVLRDGLETFAGEMDTVPARFNLLEIGGATVILDYGHNVSALAAVVEAIGGLPHERRTAIYSAAGDRRDEDLIRQGEMLGDAFDRVVLYEDSYIRGRQPGEITRLFRQGLETGTRVSDIRDFQGALKSVEAVLRDSRAGDLLVIQANEIDATMDFIHRYLGTKADGREIGLTEAIESAERDPVGVFAQTTD